MGIIQPSADVPGNWNPWVTTPITSLRNDAVLSSLKGSPSFSATTLLGSATASTYLWAGSIGSEPDQWPVCCPGVVSETVTCPRGMSTPGSNRLFADR